MLRIRDITTFLEGFAPPVLAESWDNVGLLVGDDQARAERIMTCLTITPASAQEAAEAGAHLIVTHHPLPFRPLKQITSATPEGRLLLDLIAAQIAIYSPHTAFDSAAAGINQRLAEGLHLQNVRPLLQASEVPGGSGRCGELPAEITLEELAASVRSFLKIPHVQAVGQLKQRVKTIAVACGSAGEFLPIARQNACDCLVTGEVRFHTALEAEATGITLLLAGHFASERFGVEALAEVLAKQFPSAEVWASRQERDPLVWL